MSFRYFYIMRILSFLFVFILGISCTEKVKEPKPLIEIYELNKWVESYESVPLDSAMVQAFEANQTDTTDYRYSERYGLLINGAFKASVKDLKEKPLITNKQIRGYDFSSNSIVLDSTATTKLNTDFKYRRAKQLVLTYNKNIILNFYKFRLISSDEVGNAPFFFQTNDIFLEEDNPTYKHFIKLRHGPFRDNDWVNNIPDLKQDTAFYNAFKRAGKIIAE
ncbi:hypothetical protein LY02_00916 [Nonlabens ulvanivorans]|uniref:Uncharacterized protein n=2 Tax=Nonlabens ulvanivorans TaxID=906888 RepID=A0ABX5E8X8_NONUL|nr:hypothetical protein LY02_00916 [Nonlabens ulvanivorans]